MLINNVDAMLSRLSIIFKAVPRDISSWHSTTNKQLAMRIKAPLNALLCYIKFCMCFNKKKTYFTL